MKGLVGIVGLLLVVAIVGMLAKKQLGGASGEASASRDEAAQVAVPTGTPKQQVQKVQQSVEGLMQQPRPDPDAPAQ
jgi:flagellin-like protein